MKEAPIETFTLKAGTKLPLGNQAVIILEEPVKIKGKVVVRGISNAIRLNEDGSYTKNEDGTSLEARYEDDKLVYSVNGKKVKLLHLTLNTAIYKEI